MVEGLEMPDRRFVVGVQWHPETFWNEEDSFQALVRRSRGGDPGLRDAPAPQCAGARHDLHPGPRAAPGGPGPPEGIQWEKKFDEAMKHAREVDKPIMVDFWADWCGWCHRLDRTTYVDPVVAAKAENFVTVKVDTEGGRREVEIVETYEVHNLPTVLFLSPRGHQVMRVNGFQGPGRFPHTMDQALEAARRVSAWEDALERNPADAAALFALGQHLFEQDCYEESYEMLARPPPTTAGGPPTSGAARAFSWPSCRTSSVSSPKRSR